MYINILLIMLGFFILVKGSDIFVDGIVSIANNLKIPKLIIAMTLIAFGTSAPEFAISIQGMINNSGSIVLANVIGSTIVNTMLVIGLSSLIRPIKVKSETIKKQLPFHLITISVFCILYLLTNSITRIDGLILILIFIAFLYYISKFVKKKNIQKTYDEPKWNIIPSIILTLFGLLMISIGSDIAVNNCVEIAKIMHISEKLITMIILVIGTSSPEIVLAITSVKKKEFDIILGNIIGTNIFNICFVIGIPVLLFGTVSSIDFQFIDIFVLSIASLIIYTFAKDDKIISKKEGIIMLTIFFEYYLYVVLTGI